MPSKTSQSKSPLATLESFIIGLSYQIPPSKLSSMNVGTDIQRLFLERSTEALPMGSKIRNSVGNNFEEGLRLLQSEIAKRMRENERTTTESSASPAKRSKVQKNKGDKKSSHKYVLMAFSRDSYDKFSPTDERLKLCSDYVSSTNFLRETKDVVESYKHALLYNRRDKSFVDHQAFIFAFINQLQDDASDDATNLENTEKSIREFVSCLVLGEVPSGAALKVGELIGRYAQVYFRLNSTLSVSDGQDQTNVVGNVISMSMALHSFSAESIASFVAGYINYAMETIKEEPRSKTLQHVFVRMTAALSRSLLHCNNFSLLNLRIPTVGKNLVRNKAAANQFNDAKAQMTKLMSWTTEYVSIYSESDDNNEADLANESEEDAETEDDESMDGQLRRSTRKRKKSA